MMKKLITGGEIYSGDFGEFSIDVDTMSIHDVLVDMNKRIGL